MRALHIFFILLVHAILHSDTLVSDLVMGVVARLLLLGRATDNLVLSLIVAYLILLIFVDNLVVVIERIVDVLLLIVVNRDVLKKLA